ncbi:hypothetical protein B7P43_G17747, partial [Cryptotermes secundus]
KCAIMNYAKIKDSSLLQRLFSCFKSQRKKECVNHTRNKLLEWHLKHLPIKQDRDCDNTHEPIPLATWPGQQLYNSVEATIAQNTNFALAHISTIQREIETELEESCPFELKDQYDFCMICSESDICEAEKLTENLSTQFELVGHLVWNSVYLGADHFTVFEQVMQRSSVVIFYITRSFLEDKFCCHVTRNKLVSPAQICGTIRNIPLLIDPDVALPESLRLIQKLTLQYIGAQFPKIFTDKVRFEKIERHVQCEMLIDSNRLSLIRDAVKRISAR